MDAPASPAMTTDFVGVEEIRMSGRREVVVTFGEDECVAQRAGLHLAVNTFGC